VPIPSYDEYIAMLSRLTEHVDPTTLISSASGGIEERHVPRVLGPVRSVVGLRLRLVAD
jgi:hypothetical protein